MAIQRALRDLASQTLDVAATRLELASLEALQARDRLLCRVAVLVLAWTFIVLALLVVSLALALWAWPTEHRMVVLFCMAGGYAVLGMGLVLWLVRRLRRDGPLFAVTLDVLRQDAQALRPAAPPGAAPSAATGPEAS